MVHDPLLAVLHSEVPRRRRGSILCRWQEVLHRPSKIAATRTLPAQAKGRASGKRYAVAVSKLLKFIGRGWHGYSEALESCQIVQQNCDGRLQSLPHSRRSQSLDTRRILDVPSVLFVPHSF